MNDINYFSNNLDVKNKTVLLRLDLNVPLKDKIIQDDTRILLSIPFIKKLIEKKAKIIILSHLGRPGGKRVSELSMLPIYKYLKKNLDTNVYFFVGELNSEIKEKFSYQQEGEIILFENIRFFKEETDNDDSFSKKLASLCDVYINDAFSCSHREQASVHKITKYAKKSFAGPLLKKEIDAINLIIKNKKKPVTCIIGGSKISTKINVIVGAMANNFLTFNGYKIGASLVENKTEKIIKKIYDDAKSKNCKILIPEDCKVGSTFNGNGEIKRLTEIKKNEMILDIGPQTIVKIHDKIDSSKTILWNGPAGYFENEEFNIGTTSIANKISENTNKGSLVSVLGGGDTLSAINKYKKKLFFTHLSTAGGAFLEYLEGKDLPGISVLK